MRTISALKPYLILIWSALLLLGQPMSAGSSSPAPAMDVGGDQEETSKKPRRRRKRPSAAADTTAPASRTTRQRPPSQRQTRSRRPTRRRRKPPAQPVAKTYTETELRDMTAKITALNEQLATLNRRTARRLAHLAPADSVPMSQRFRFEGEYERVRELERRVAENPNDQLTQVALAQLQARNHKYRSAEEHLQRALAAEPLNQELLFDLGRQHLQAGSTARAWSTFQEIIYLNPESYAARLAQGEVREADRDFTGAMAIYRQVEERFGPLAEVYYNRSINLVLRGSFGEAVTVARTGLEQYPDHAALFYARGRAYAGLGMLDRAKIDLYDALSLEVNYYAVYPVLGDLSSQEGNYSTAIRVYLRYLDEYPGDEPVSFSLGRAYLSDLRFHDAVREWELWLYLHGPSEQVNQWLPRAYYLQSLEFQRQGQFHQALDAHGKAMALAGGNSARWLVPALVGAGEAAREQGEYNRSRDYFDRALEMDPFSVDSYVGLSLTYAALQDTIQARSTLRRALSLDADHPRARVVQLRLSQP